MTNLSQTFFTCHDVFAKQLADVISRQMHSIAPPTGVLRMKEMGIYMVI
jgi:hypothetical protein